MTTAVEVGPSFSRERRTAWYGVRPGVGERRGVHRVEAVGKRDQVPGARHEEVLRHAAVQAETATAAGHGRQVGPVAVRLEPRQAALAGPAAPGADDGHRLADLEAADPGAQGVHPAGVLVAERERRRPGQAAGLELVHQVQVGVAGAGAADLDQHLAGPGLGDGHVLEDGVALPGVESQGLHLVLQGPGEWVPLQPAHSGPPGHGPAAPTTRVAGPEPPGQADFSSRSTARSVAPRSSSGSVCLRRDDGVIVTPCS